MRAKTINEVQKFERGIDPKKAMGIGGVILYDIYKETVNAAYKQWSNYVFSLSGKKVTFNTDEKHYISDENKGVKTLIVTDIVASKNGDVQLYNEEGQKYYVDITKPIYISSVNEAFSRFQRGLNPKAAMGIGGVTFKEAYDSIIQPAIEKWGKYVKSALLGKTISGDFHKFDGKKWIEVEHTTFKVVKIVNWELEGDINVKDEDDNLYFIKIDQKIHIG